MSVKSDRWIRRMAREHRMIEPFTEKQMRDGVISYGLSSYGYDVRIADEFKIFTNINSTIVDPKAFDPRSFVDFKGEVCIIPPNSFALARTVEYFRIPRNVITVCVGKCVGGGTRVVDGASGRLAPIATMVGRAGSAASLRGQRLATADVTEGVRQGRLPVYEIATRTGRTLRATPNHPLLTFTGWRPLQELWPGDRIGVPRRLPVFGERRMPACEVDLLGLMLADGGRRTPGPLPRDAGADPVLRRYFEEAATAFGGAAEPGRVQRWLASLGLDLAAPETAAPPAVFELRRPLLARFLRALFSGGGEIGGGPDPLRLELPATSQALARDVQHLLVRFGVVACLGRRKTAPGGGAWMLTVAGQEPIARFAGEIGFVDGSHKQRRLQEALSRTTRHPGQESDDETLPREAWALLGAACRAQGVPLHRAGAAGMPPGRSLPRTLAMDVARRLGVEALGAIADSDVSWDAIEAKRFVGVEDVYDLTLPETANFVADDVVVHNSTYARCGIIVNVTPFEPEWEGIVTLEVSNTTPLPAKIYAGEGVAQVLFFESDEPCETSYADKKGKYQAQQALTLPRL